MNLDGGRAGRSGGVGGGPAAALKAAIAAEGHAYATVISASMAPTLQPGDVVRVESARLLRPGRIAVYERGRFLVTHRVVSVSPAGIVCCGDARRRRDPLVPWAAVCGAAVSVSPSRRLRGGTAALLLARSRYWLTAGPRLWSDARAELQLLRLQLTGGRPAPWLGAEGPRDTSGQAHEFLGPEAVVRLLSARGAPLKGVGAEIPAGVYGALPPEERRRLLGLLSGSDVLVWGRLAEGPRLRLTAALRGLLEAVGIAAGQPGDLAVPRGRRGWRLLHYFDVDELATELRAAGAQGVEVGVVAHLDGRFVRAVASLPPAAEGD